MVEITGAELTAPYTVRMRTWPADALRRHETLVEVRAAGVCGTDIAIYTGSYAVPLPLVLGHEFCGVVREVGEGADRSLAGKRVVGEINTTCLAWRRDDPCPACRDGRPNHCTQRDVLGIVGASGAFATHVCVPEGSLHVLPDEVSDETAVFIEPLAAAIRTFELSPFAEGSCVVVLGAGRLGTLVVWVARQLGGQVIAVAPSEKSRTRALEFGAELAFSPHDDKLAKAVAAATGGLGADLVVEATGLPEGFGRALELVRPRGTIALKTTCGLPSGGVDATKLVVDEITVQGSRCGPFDKAILFLTRHKPDIESLVERVFPLHETAAAIEAARTATKVLIKQGN
ncbi:MAG: alcohol dehydrogenase catalytic domain-containing protein [Verrucomicrobia bacterium]|nr:alcohol dehydrogenase catalytic domain-containing protein [Verrucomicrobiota bacterium]